MFGDLHALLLSQGATTLVVFLPTKEPVYGLHRAEIFAAFINSLLLTTVSQGISREAYRRMCEPCVAFPLRQDLMFPITLADHSYRDISG